jgi:hypothetical protein
MEIDYRRLADVIANEIAAGKLRSGCRHSGSSPLSAASPTLRRDAFTVNCFGAISSSAKSGGERSLLPVPVQRGLRWQNQVGSALISN